MIDEELLALRERVTDLQQWKERSAEVLLGAAQDRLRAERAEQALREIAGDSNPFTGKHAARAVAIVDRYFAERGMS